MTTSEMTAKEEGRIAKNGNGRALMAGSLFIAGGLAGALLGILYAPRKGKETREEIRHSAEELAKKAKGQYMEVYQKIGSLASRQKESVIGKKEKLKKAVEAGVEAYQR